MEVYRSITWTPTIGFCAGLCWRGKKPMERRAGFPSWSWTGWKLAAEGRTAELEAGLQTSAHARQWTVPVEWFLKETEWGFFQGNQNLKAHLDVEQGRLDLDDAEFERHYEHLDGRLPAVLHLSAWCTPISIISWGSPNLSRGRPARGEPLPVIAKVEGAEDGRKLIWKFLATTATRPPAKASAYIAIELGRHADALVPPTTFVLVAVEVGEGVYERVGIGKSDQYNPRDPSKIIDGEEALFRFGREIEPLAVVKFWKEFQLR